MSEPLAILGGLTAEQFLAEYWQKKPLLVKNAMPELVGMFEPDDIKQLALQEYVSARLITQHGADHQQWRLKSSPLSSKDLKQVPEYWTLLVQAVDHYSFELAELWKKFDFLPLWRRDDIMVSYAKKGGSVGPHFDFYDVFLVQGYGHRRWQLGQYCDEHTAFVPKQPIKLLTDMQVDFDQVFAPGDLLYLPPQLSHYGVAEDECLTFSFGFRMPNQAQLIDRVSDQFADQQHYKTPIIDLARHKAQPSGQVSTQEFAYMKQQLLTAIAAHPGFEDALMGLISEPKYPDNISEAEATSVAELKDYATLGILISVEPASRLLYQSSADQQLQFWGNGEKLCLHRASQLLFKELADGAQLPLDLFLAHSKCAEDLVEALNQSLLIILDPDEDQDE